MIDYLIIFTNVNPKAPDVFDPAKARLRNEAIWLVKRFILLMMPVSEPWGRPGGLPDWTVQSKASICDYMGGNLAGAGHTKCT
jgi:hypothetical protein